MEKVILSRQEYMDLISRKPDFSGSEGNLYKKGQRLYKLYHNPYIYSDRQLEQIISFQPVIQLTKFPLGALYFEKHFIGSILYYYVDAVSFETIYQREPAFKIQKLKELSILLQELTNHGLILEDLYYENVVITKDGKTALIDTDGDNVRILKTDNQFQQLLRYLKGMIIECFQKELDISNNELPKVEKQRLSYEALEQFLHDLESKVYQKTIH